MAAHVNCVLRCAESVAERSDAVNSKLQLRRDQIEELSQVKDLLTKLQAVFDLPRRLRTALNRGALEIAADAYADAAPLLKRYGHKVCNRAISVDWLLIETLCSLRTLSIKVVLCLQCLLRLAGLVHKCLLLCTSIHCMQVSL